MKRYPKIRFCGFWLSCYLRANSMWNTITAPRSRPPVNVPSELLDDFTINSKVPILKWYLNDTKSRPLKWTTRSWWWNEDNVKNKRQRYYGATDTFLYEVLEKFDIRGKEVVVVGSEMPWYECICSYYGASVTTIEYRTVDCQIPSLTVMTPDEFARNPRKFDVAVSISAIEHDGLGRYGDPIDPTGDLKAMQQIRGLLKPDGWLILAVPVGSDLLVWNSHRTYGRIRLPLLMEGWEVLDSSGFSEDLLDAELGEWDPQPVFVLRPDEKTGTSI